MFSMRVIRTASLAAHAAALTERATMSVNFAMPVLVVDDYNTMVRRCTV